jgi:UrcA family protein
MKSTSKNQFKSAVFILTIGISTFGLATIGGAAQAADSQQSLSKKVTYGDLNLDAPEGAKALYARLRRAASDVCRPFEGHDLVQQSSWQACFNGSVSRAVTQVNKSSVTALHTHTINGSTTGRVS